MKAIKHALNGSDNTVNESLSITITIPTSEAVNLLNHLPIGTCPRTLVALVDALPPGTLNQLPLDF